jgi:hypothetical protein
MWKNKVQCFGVIYPISKYIYIYISVGSQEGWRDGMIKSDKRRMYR